MRSDLLHRRRSTWAALAHGEQPSRVAKVSSDAATERAGLAEKPPRRLAKPKKKNLQIPGLGMVARDGIEPSTRGFLEHQEDSPGTSKPIKSDG